MIVYLTQGMLPSRPMADIPIDSGFLEVLGRRVFKPRLKVVYKGPRKYEEVAIQYPSGHYDPFYSAGSTATVTKFGHTHGRAIYIRGWVYNLFGFAARACEVYVNRISVNGRVLDAERSPLHWADTDKEFQVPLIRKGYENGVLVDICAADSIERTFEVITRKWYKGYHRFREPGVYVLDLSAEAHGPCAFGKLTLSVRYDGKDKWSSMHVVSAKESRSFLRWW